MFSKYLSIMRLGWLDAIEYRTEFFIGIFGWSIRLVIALFLWAAVAQASGGTVGGYTFPEIMVYFLVVQILSSFIFSRVSFVMAMDIYRGDFVNFLLKPINYVGMRMVHELTRNAFRTILTFLLFGVVIAFVGELPGLTATRLGIAILSMIGAYLLNFFIVGIIALSAFWITSSNRLTFIYFGILTIFSGMMIPLDLFPEPFKEIVLNLPFAFIFYFPAKVFQNPADPLTFLPQLGLQWLYLSLIGLLMWFLYRRGVRHFEAVGR
ncbi:hypothetical protein CO046_03195 [Candidatus Peregrinibacteria bacterium CG_4_9_14_0_2_um_filter_53_11]|nr:MAG: hypothetical protein CO046_03195 [Candidatus Peregrinibacteria bacterium CG_4_9_14_0_2_um_filter_53_11]